MYKLSNKTMKCAIYIRTSTMDQNPENQLRDCYSIISNKWEEPIVYADQQSAWKDNIERDNFGLLLKVIKTRRLNHLIVWDLDRLYRNKDKLISFFKMCKVYDCKIHSYRQMFLEELLKMPAPFDDMMHEFMLKIMGWLAEEESNKKSERVKAAVREKDGITFSYKGNKWGRKRLSTYKANMIYKLHNDGLSMGKIANELSVSKGAVHKYLHGFGVENVPE